MAQILVLLFFSMEDPHRESLSLKEVAGEEGVCRFIGHDELSDDGSYPDSLRTYFSRKNIQVQAFRSALPCSALESISDADPASDTWNSPFTPTQFVPSQESIQALADLVGMPVRVFENHLPEPIRETFRAEPSVSSAA